MSCAIEPGSDNPLTYQLTSRYRDQGDGYEKQLKESDIIEEVSLVLPVGNYADGGFMLEVVVRAFDIYGGSAEGVISFQVRCEILVTS